MKKQASSSAFVDKYGRSYCISCTDGCSDRRTYRFELRGRRADSSFRAGCGYRKAEDAGLLLPIRAIIDERPTYGYRRVWALLKRHPRNAGKPTVNMKRVLRIMRNHGLTLERHTARRPDRTHDGIVIALHSNIQWCSDHLELHAGNREVVRICSCSILRPRDHRLVGRGERRDNPMDSHFPSAAAP